MLSYDIRNQFQTINISDVHMTEDDLAEQQTDPEAGLYARLILKLQTDDEWMREVTAGRRIGLYRSKGDLGIGNFSRVRLAQHELTQERVAIKIIDRSNLDAKTTKMLLREISVMASCNHPCLVRLFEVIEKKDKIFLCMQLAPGGELFTRLTNCGKYPEEKAKILFAQIASGIGYMHSHGMIHRDLKAENVFFLDPEKVIIGDFGFATKLNSMDQHLTTFCGSPPYAAPELFKDDYYVGPAVDIWALGILLYFMVTGNMPFKSATVSGLKHAILEGTYFNPPTLSDECKELINGLLQRSPNHRISISGVRKCSWLTKVPWIEEDSAFVPYPRVNSSNLSDVEKAVMKQLQALGITEMDFSQEMGLGIRSKAVGAYRILLTKQIMMQEKKKEQSCESSFAEARVQRKQSRPWKEDTGDTPLKGGTTPPKGGGSALKLNKTSSKSRLCDIL